MARDKTSLVILVLIIVIVCLVGVLGYSFLVKPGFDNYVFEKQMETYNQGVSDTIMFMVDEINQRGYTQISIGNQTLALAPVQFQPQAPAQ